MAASSHFDLVTELVPICGSKRGLDFQRLTVES
jgi:hypothetical protein